VGDINIEAPGVAFAGTRTPAWTSALSRHQRELYRLASSGAILPFDAGRAARYGILNTEKLEGHEGPRRRRPIAADKAPSADCLEIIGVARTPGLFIVQDDYRRQIPMLEDTYFPWPLFVLPIESEGRSNEHGLDADPPSEGGPMTVRSVAVADRPPIGWP
jgi:hypothetical protein